MKSRVPLGGAALVAIFVLFVGATILSNDLLRGAQLDLTANKLYTISPGTKNVLRALPEPVNLYYFFSEKAAAQYPTLNTYGTRVREFLEELVSISGGKLRLARIDPQAFSDEEDRAAELGITAIPTGSGQPQVYFGLAATNSTDGRGAIPYFDAAKEPFLEYDVVKLIYELGNPKKPVVGWLSSLPIGAPDPRTGRPGEPPAMLTQAEQIFTIRQIDSTATKLDADLDVLVLVHPKGLPAELSTAIDAYARKGGRLLVFVDPFAEEEQPAGADPNTPAPPDRASHIEKLLESWGIDFDPTQVVGDAEHALMVPGGRDGQGVRHLGILGLNDGNFNAKEVVTAGLSSINVATAGALKARTGATTTFEPLIQTGAQAALIPAARFAMLSDPQTLLAGFKPTGERYTLAARITGKAPTAYNIVVVADSDLLADFLWVRHQQFFGERVSQPFANNGDLVWNAIDNLAGSNDLIGLRGRASFSRPFERVEALRRGAEQRFQAKEQELEAELQQTEERLTALQSQRNDAGGSSGALILTPEQQQQLQAFQKRKVEIRRDLREVRLGLNQDIEGLGKRLKVLNVIVYPLMLALGALAFGVVRRRRATPRAAA